MAELSTPPVPAIIQSFARHAIRETPVPNIVWLRQCGQLRANLRGSWQPFTAEQVISIHRPGFAWLARHSWAWNPTRPDELIGAAAPATLYVCGCADNELELADRFTQVFLLEIDEPTMLARLDARRDYHDWGRIGDTREYLRRKLPELQERLRAFGAIPIDATQPLDQVADAILSHSCA